MPQCDRGLRPPPDRHRAFQWSLHPSQIGNSIFQMNAIRLQLLQSEVKGTAAGPLERCLVCLSLTRPRLDRRSYKYRMGLDESHLPGQPCNQSPATQTDELSKLKIHSSSLLIMVVSLAGSRSGGKHETGARVSAGDATRVLGQPGDGRRDWDSPRARPNRASSLGL